ncbi:hypothetical protein ACQKO5_23070 [Novosphingobium subterraneum]|uniref:hypothetical protein n=1 Tax=Novosphingobium subterraneum TaxID=48936 RepID=UPI003CFEB147
MAYSDFREAPIQTMAIWSPIRNKHGKMNAALSAACGLIEVWADAETCRKVPFFDSKLTGTEVAGLLHGLSI